MKRVIKSSYTDRERYDFDDGYYVELDYQKRKDQYIWTLYNKDDRICNGGYANKPENAIRNCEAYLARNKNRKGIKSSGDLEYGDEYNWNPEEWFPYDLGQWEDVNSAPGKGITNYTCVRGGLEATISILDGYGPIADIDAKVSTKWMLDEEDTGRVGKGITTSFRAAVDKINRLIERSQNLQDSILIPY